MANCEICLSSVKDQEEYKLSGGHKFCKGCMQEHLKYRFYRKQFINCPSCARSGTQKEVFELMPKELKIKFENFKTQLMVDQNQNLHWCPRPDCNKYVEVISGVQGKKNRAVCQCGYEFCINCHSSWHPNIAGKKARDKDSLKIAKKYKKKCPRCRSPVEKIEGCNHMRCVVCHQEFCWICGAPYTPSHFKGLSPCNFEADKSLDIFLMMFILPIVLFVLPFMIIRKLIRTIHWKGKFGKGAKSCGHVLLPLLVALPLGVILQVFGPLGWIILIILWIRVQIKKGTHKT